MISFLSQVKQRAYKYRFYPTKKQATQLAETFGCCRFVYNKALSEKQKFYKNHRKSLNHFELSKNLTSWRKEFDWLKDCSSVTLQQSLRHLNKSYQNFFNKKSKYPKFKSRNSRQSISYMKNGFKWNSETKELILAKMNTSLEIKYSRHFRGIPSSLAISKDKSNRYYISFLLKEEIQELPKNNNQIGIDLGISSFSITNKGEKIENPKFLDRKLRKLKTVQKSLSRKKKGSKNRNKARLRVAKVHSKISDQRNDFLHKLSSSIINENQVIIAEKLNIKNMVKNRKLSRSISQVGWGKFIEYLKYKSKWYGRTFIQIDQWFPSSKLCSNCGFKNDKLTLSDRFWKCKECKTDHDRDINAAKNILTAGQAAIKMPLEEMSDTKKLASECSSCELGTSI